MSEPALESEHGVSSYLGNPLGHLQIRQPTFFISKEAAGQEKDCAQKIYLHEYRKNFALSKESIFVHT